MKVAPTVVSMGEGAENNHPKGRWQQQSKQNKNNKSEQQKNERREKNRKP